MKTQIILDTVIHSGKELPVYVPQVDLGSGWKNVLSPGTYILKESHNPVDLCSKCSGSGCQDCQNRGTKKGTAVDNILIAEFFLKNKIIEIQNAEKLLSTLR